MSKKHPVMPGSTYHLISRFVAKEWFVRSDVEREQYLRLLGDALDQSDWRCLAYAIMSNHIHLALEAGTDPLDSWISLAHVPFAIWINQCCERIGAVFVRGPKLVEARSDGAAPLIAYIHLNPVRAGVVAAARNSTWTSQRCYAGTAVVPRWLDVRRGLELTGFTSGRELASWVETSAVGPAELTRALVPKRPRGRPQRAATTMPPLSSAEVLARPTGSVRMLA